MEDKFNAILKACLRHMDGDCAVNVFDIMYETGLTYPELKKLLDGLVGKNELEVIDLKTYRAVRSDRRDERLDGMQAQDAPDTPDFDLSDEKELRYRALKLCIERDTVSASMLQRTFPIGYVRACKLIDWMENMGYITCGGGTEKRRVLIAAEDLDAVFHTPCDEEENYLYNFISDKDVEFSEEVVEYERYLRAAYAAGNGGEENGREQKKTETFSSNCASYFILQILKKKNKNVPRGQIPEHSLWGDEEEFMYTVSDRFVAVMTPDVAGSRQRAIKKAEQFLNEMRQDKNAPFIEVFERIIYELQSMSSYYFNKIRGLIT